MKRIRIHSLKYILVLIPVISGFAGCKKDGNPNNLPVLDPTDYQGTVGGFRTSDEILKDNLVAYFSFDDTYAEKITNTSPTQKTGDSFVEGFKGKALNLNAGYLYYATQFAAFKTDAFKSFTISQWIQISNNGSKKTMLLQLARPNVFDGNLDIRLNTNSYPATNTDILKVNPRFSTIGGGSQDNLNSTKTPKIGNGNWVHLVLSYNGLTGRFNVLTNGENIGSFSDRGTGNNLFKSNEPNELIIGANYNLIPGKSINTNADFGLMTGKIDELKIYNAFMPDAVVKALYDLSKAGK
ncbi:LamG-like jellyroll fold domain-containing protein [Pedobacter sandarakinus]|uniref:LamG-like jellyroll fold domain-containing protein n=1 Tax=Pedobacter sandarakinus TaxID=353156 RepID=UPI0022485AF8|nr:LamG-like jellyroll fold domain-containing protein [Pedobacter sandarakinus]MCX2572964.1 LamG domain-containing protein [Pedobacter sandarakinus]